MPHNLQKRGRHHSRLAVCRCASSPVRPGGGGGGTHSTWPGCQTSMFEGHCPVILTTPILAEPAHAVHLASAPATRPDNGGNAATAGRGRCHGWPREQQTPHFSLRSYLPNQVDCMGDGMPRLRSPANRGPHSESEQPDGKSRCILRSSDAPQVSIGGRQYGNLAFRYPWNV